MSSREDYKWTDEAKNLKEGLPPNHIRSAAPQSTMKDSQTKQVEQPAKNEPTPGDDADPFIEMNRAIKCLALELPREVYDDVNDKWTAYVKYVNTPKAAPKGDDVISKETIGEFIKWLETNRVFYIDEVRLWLRQYDKEEISLSKFVELFNIKVFNQFKSAPQAVKWVQAEERLPVKEYNYFVKAWNFDMKSTYNGTAHFKNGKFIDERYTVYGNPVEVKVFEWLDEGSTDKNQTK